MRIFGILNVPPAMSDSRSSRRIWLTRLRSPNRGNGSWDISACWKKWARGVSASGGRRTCYLTAWSPSKFPDASSSRSARPVGFSMRPAPPTLGYVAKRLWRTFPTMRRVPRVVGEAPPTLGYVTKRLRRTSGSPVAVCTPKGLRHIAQGCPPRDRPTMIKTHPGGLPWVNGHGCV
jgi:hypothetical protein